MALEGTRSSELVFWDNRENYGNLKNAQQKRLEKIFASTDTLGRRTFVPRLFSFY